MGHQSWSMSSSYSYTSIDGKEQAEGTAKEIKNGKVVRDASFKAADGKVKITEGDKVREEQWVGSAKSLAHIWSRPTLCETKAIEQ